MNKCLLFFWESMRRGFRMFYAPVTGAVKGAIRGIRDEYREIDQDYKSRINKRSEP